MTNQEWLLTDQHGFFAMGTVHGYRTRKYHGFFQGIAGREECSFLADLEIECAGKLLWPHCYNSDQGPVYHPAGGVQNMEFSMDPYPSWMWTLDEGLLTFSIKKGAEGGMWLNWSWSARSNKRPAATRPVWLKVRPFFSMRDLHALGGQLWEFKQFGNHEAEVVSSNGRRLQCMLKDGLKWRSAPEWYRRFHYSEEIARGYPSDEDLYSAGIMIAELKHGASCSLGLAKSLRSLNAGAAAGATKDQEYARRDRALDFVLTEPAGIVAGFPWFGEWGRDTFISLPGITVGLIRDGKNPKKVASWTEEVLLRWGSWITKRGMLPNLIDKGGTQQWDSADATLWWCHSLASLWQFSLCGYPALGFVKKRFSALLDEAIESISGARHRFLHLSADGLLEVTEPHATWMDARVGGVSVTPRVGRLPEINALWFQARCLQLLWSGKKNGSEQLEAIGRAVLESCGERDRPNEVFLHSIPLSPSFVLNDKRRLSLDLAHIAEEFWTPVGLRTLSAKDPRFRAYCVGTQEQRDSSYHQGSVWGWLGGHYEMARARLKTELKHEVIKDLEADGGMLSATVLEDMPILGHIAEIFDAKPPYAARGAPAQAWSLACLVEARERKRLRADLKLTNVLAGRWLGRRARVLRRTAKRKVRA